MYTWKISVYATLCKWYKSTYLSQYETSTTLKLQKISHPHVLETNISLDPALA